MDLSGHTALVTGGAHRLGREFALVLAGAGADVAIHYNSSADEALQTVADLEALGVKACALPADLADPDAAAGLIEQAGDAFQYPSLLINSAAVFRPGSLVKTALDDWDAHFNLNLRAPFLLTQAFARVAGERGGKVVNIVDWRGATPDCAYTAYSLSKHGLIALTRMAALELAPHIQVNALALGAVLPPPGEDDGYLHRVARQAPAGRPCDLAELSQALLFLLSCDFVTGEVLFLDGGAHLQGPWSDQ
ncbi:MAG TPA: SDR family oxidoreductase [bacterium]|nr:SDR family oxidoreductase [bacterium]